MKKVHRAIKFNQKSNNINMNTKQEPKNNFEKDLFELMNNAVFGKTIENVRKHKNIKFLTT